jgi:hypothetical protein
LKRYVEELRLLTTAGLIAAPGITIFRNVRHAYVLGNSVRLSREQIPEIYGALERQCAALGMTEIPGLYLSDCTIREGACAYSSWKRHYIVISDKFVESDLDEFEDVYEFMIARELGSIRLGHTTWYRELFVTHLLKIPFLRNPLLKVQTYSCDRYGAFLAPHGIRYLLVGASGRAMLRSVSVGPYVKQALQYGGAWARAAEMGRETPHFSSRVQALYRAGLLAAEPEAASACDRRPCPPAPDDRLPVLPPP